MMKRVICLAIPVVFLFGCAYTKTTAYKDPNVAAASGYHRLVVVSANDDLAQRQAVEQAFVQQLAAAGVSATEGTSLFPPTQDLSPQEAVARASEAGYDGILIVGMTDAYYRTLYTGGYATSWYSRGRVSTYYSPPGAINMPTAKFKVSLFDVKTGQKAWMSDCLTSGNAYAGAKVMYNSLAHKTVEKLKSDRII